MFLTEFTSPYTPPTCFGTPWVPSSGAFTLIKVVLSKWSVVCSSHTHTHTHTHTHILKFQFNAVETTHKILNVKTIAERFNRGPWLYIIPSKLRSSKWSLSFRPPPAKTLYVPALSIRATCPACVVPDFITQIVFGGEYRSWRSSLCSLFYSPVTSSLLGPTIFLRTLFSNTLCLWTKKQSNRKRNPANVSAVLLNCY